MKFLHLMFVALILSACAPSPGQLTAIAETALAQTLTAAPTFTPTLTPTATLTLTPTLTPTSTPLPVEDPVFVGAGDIAACSSNGDEITASLLDGIEGTVFTTGDNVYNSGTPAQFRDCYDPTWGRHKARTFPSPGNHDYGTAGAAGYYEYFGSLAGEPDKGYYSYDLGQWHIIVLNSNIAVGIGSPQEQWLRADLAAHPTACTAAYWHHPLFSSGAVHGSDSSMRPLWQALYDYGADIVLNGHEHNYERFAPQTPDGVADAIRGIREFVVGTGGRSLYSFFGSAIPNSEARDSLTYGVLKLTLHASSYSWEFIPEPGKSFTDSGSASCVTPQTAASTSPPTAGVYDLTFLPTDDATLEAQSPDANFGSERRLKTDQSPQGAFLIKFTVSGIAGHPVQRALLRLYNVNPSDGGVEFFRVEDQSWSETSVTWNLAPIASPELLAAVAPLGGEGWYEVDVSSLITGDGIFSVYVVANSDNGADFSSKEGPAEFVPQLAIDLAEVVTPTP